MKSSYEKFRGDLMLQAILMIALGLFLFLWPGNVQDIIGYVIAGGLILIGVVKIIGYFAGPKKAQEGELMEYSSPKGLVSGILLIVFAALISKIMVSIIPILLGIVVLYSGLVKLDQAIQLIRSKQGNYVGILIVAFLTIIVGVLSIFQPSAVNKILFQLIGAGLIFGGATDLISTGYVTSKFKKMNASENSAEEDE